MLGILAASEEASFGRDHFDPGHFTASAFVVAPDRQRILLILHGKFGIWLQPGGHVDPSDADIVAAARREVIEETGLREGTIGLSELFDGLLDVDIHDIPPNPSKGEPAHQHLDVRFCFQAMTDRIVAGSDAKDARWVRLGEADLLETDESVRRALRKLRAAW
jgi:8-oxo-dGTP pyrophosphatase MutT (NUDIX family)